jgi:hypothetical protein
MSQSRTCLQRVARYHVRVLSFGLRHYRGPQKPGHIKTTLSTRSPLPILVEYKCSYGNVAGSALWRLRAAFEHRDCVREISFEGSNANFKRLFRATKCSFPVLKSLLFCFGHDHEQNIQVTLLGGQNYQNCFYDVLVWTTFPSSGGPSQPCPDFCCPQRLSPTSCVGGQCRHRIINRSVPRNAFKLPAQSRVVHITQSPRPLVAAFSSQRY